QHQEEEFSSTSEKAAVLVGALGLGLTEVCREHVGSARGEVPRGRAALAPALDLGAAQEGNGIAEGSEAGEAVLQVAEPCLSLPSRAYAVEPARPPRAVGAELVTVGDLVDVAVLEEDRPQLPARRHRVGEALMAAFLHPGEDAVVVPVGMAARHDAESLEKDQPGGLVAVEAMSPDLLLEPDVDLRDLVVV